MWSRFFWNLPLSLTILMISSLLVYLCSDCCYFIAHCLLRVPRKLSCSHLFYKQHVSYMMAGLFDNHFFSHLVSSLFYSQFQTFYSCCNDVFFHNERIVLINITTPSCFVKYLAVCLPIFAPKLTRYLYIPNLCQSKGFTYVFLVCRQINILFF